MSALRIAVPGKEPEFIHLGATPLIRAASYHGSLVVGMSGSAERTDSEKERERIRRNNAKRPTTRAGRSKA